MIVMKSNYNKIKKDPKLAPKLDQSGNLVKKLHPRHSVLYSPNFKNNDL